MFFVIYFDDATCCDEIAFSGSYDQCVAYVDGDDDYYIVDDDFFPVD